MSPGETISMKGQILFSEKNKKSITILLAAELAQRVIKINEKTQVFFKTCLTSDIFSGKLINT